MWDIGELGFASAVRKHKSDATLITVRFRAKVHAENYKAAFPDLLKDCVIRGKDDPEVKKNGGGTDYPWAMFVPEEAWGMVGYRLYKGTVESNFKNHLYSVGMNAFHDKCYEVFDVMGGYRGSLDAAMAKDAPRTKPFPFKPHPDTVRVQELEAQIKKKDEILQDLAKQLTK